MYRKISIRAVFYQDPEKPVFDQDTVRTEFYHDIQLKQCLIKTVLAELGSNRRLSKTLHKAGEHFKNFPPVCPLILPVHLKGTKIENPAVTKINTASMLYMLVSPENIVLLK